MIVQGWNIKIIVREVDPLFLLTGTYEPIPNNIVLRTIPQVFLVSQYTQLELSAFRQNSVLQTDAPIVKMKGCFKGIFRHT